MDILRLTGTRRQRGQIHGEHLRDQIASVTGLWKSDIQRYTRLSPDVYIQRFLAETDFVQAIERWAPRLLDEVHGIAEGANQPFQTILAFQCMDEDWWFRDTVAETREHCSAFGICERGEAPLVAQNMEIHPMTDGHQVLLHLQEKDRGAFVFSFAGFIGLTGLNDRPLAVCCNTLMQLPHSRRGLPVAFVIRRLLEQADILAAEAFLRQVEHASGQNYLLGGAAGIRDFECSANGVTQFGAGRKRLWHTNHPLANPDPRPEKQDHFNSQQRLDLLESRLGKGKINVDIVKSVLRQPPVCVEKDQYDDLFTSGSLVMVLSDSPELHISQGPPSSHEYRTVHFDRSD